MKALVALILLANCSAIFAEQSEGQKMTHTRILYALFFVPTPAKDPETVIKQIVKDRFAASMSFENGGAEKLTIKSLWAPTKECEPPSPEKLKYYGRGVTEEQAKRMGESERAFILIFDIPHTLVLQGNKDVCVLLADLAEATKGFPYDPECRLIFDTKSWRTERVEGWVEGVPDISKHVCMHQYRKGDLFRIITLGMRKFGKPDIVATEVSAHESRCTGLLINACAQHLVEGAIPKENGFVVDFSSIKNPQMKVTLQANPGKGATGKALIGLRKTKPDEGDPENDLVAIDFPETKGGGSISERRNALLAGLFGASDSLIDITNGDKELAAASARAQKRAIQLIKPRFEKQLEPNEHVLAKFPFATPTSNKEFMWVEITSWKDGSITGILENDPFEVPNLKAGAKVSVKEQELYDYIWQKNDGSQEGNETGKIMERMQER